MESSSIVISITSLIDATGEAIDLIQKTIRSVQRGKKYDLIFSQLLAEFQSLKRHLRAIIEAIDLGNIDDETKHTINSVVRGYRNVLQQAHTIISSQFLPSALYSKRNQRQSRGWKIDDLTSVLHPHTQGISRLASQLEWRQLRKDRRAVRRWLSATSPYKRYEDVLRQRHPNTGAWMLENDAYLTWRDGHTSASCLWVQGPPGSGKTVLSTIAIENLQSQRRSVNHGVAFFFFEMYSDFGNNGAEMMVRSLISQLLDQSSWSTVDFDELVRPYGPAGTEPPLNALLVVLRQMINDFDQTYVVVDALDECDAEDTLFEAISTINAWHLKNLRIMLTSRPVDRIKNLMERATDQRAVIRLECQPVEIEIREYIRASLSQMNGGPKLMGSERQIEEILAQESYRSYLIARYQEDLLISRRYLEVVETPTNLPAFLAELYIRILSVIPENLTNATVRVLQWLVFAKRPLTVPELAETITIDFPQISSGFELQDTLYLLGIFPSLATIQGGDANTSRQESIVTLSDLSVREFLMSDACRTSRVAHFYMKSEECNSILGDRCLDYLLQFDSRDDSALERMENAKLAQYAAQYWIEHIRDGLDSTGKLSQPRVMQLFTPGSSAFYNWAHFYDHDNTGEGMNITREANTITSPLYYASRLGLEGVVRSLLDSPSGLQVNGETLQTMLQAAVMEGQEGIVNHLIHHGMSVDAQVGFHGTVLQAASFMGHEAIVRQLLDAGADPNAGGGEYSSALQAACIKGHDSIVRLLIDRGADLHVVSQGGSYFTPLQTAASGGHASTARLLLAVGANVDAQRDDGETALEAASLRGHFLVVQLLCKAGADILKGSRKHGSPLNAAAIQGHFDIAKLLIDSGASVNDVSGKYGHALQASSSKGHGTLVRLLIESKADVNAQGGFFGFALYAAAARGHRQIVTALLQAGANIDATFEDGGTALYAASLAGYEQVVQELLDAGAKVNADGGQYGHALQASSHEGHQSIVSILLEAKADVNAVGGEYGTALEAACHCGHAVVADQLIRGGAEVNVQAGFYGTALQAAAFSGQRDLVKMLLAKGATVNGTGGYYGHALEAASHQGHNDVVEILLEANADVNLRGGEYDCALNAALCENNHSVLHRLLQAGASTASVDDDSKDAASKAVQTTTNLTQWINDFKSRRLMAPITVTLRFETEIPAVIGLLKERVDDKTRMQGRSTDIRSTFFNNVIIVRKRFLVAQGELTTALEALTLREYTTRRWGALAEQVVDDLLNAFALDAGARQFNSYAAVDEFEIEYSIAFSDGYLLVHLDKSPLDANFVSLVEVIDTMCRAVRTPQDPSAAGVVWLSSAQYRGYELDKGGRTIPTVKTTRTGLHLNSVLSAALVNDFQDQCWQPLFKSCFVVDEYRLSVSNKALGKGLEMSFDLMTVLAGAEYFVPFEKSMLLVGYQTVLFPTSTKEDYAQFHLVVDKEKQINPFQQDYGRLALVEDLSLFRKRRCFVGWCDVAQINLGTRDMLQHEVTYSTANERDRSLVMTGISVGTQATSIAPLQIGGNVAVSFGFVSHHLSFPPNSIFSKLLNDAAQQTILIFDTAARQSWLVPKLSLLLHMAHVWFLRRNGGATNIAADRIPFATPHESADSLKILLQGQGQVVVCGQGDDAFHLRTLMIGLSHNLLAAVRDVRQSRSGRLFGFEFMDIVTEPARGGTMRSVKVTSGHAWLELANAVDAVVFCANLGEAIRPKEDAERRRNKTCNSLPSARDFLAAHISCLLHIAVQVGVSQAAPAGVGLHELVQIMLLEDRGVQLHHAHSLNLVGDPFGVCNHQPDDPSSCWSRRDMIQSLVRGGFRGVLSTISAPPRSLPPPTLSNAGAVVFGL